MKHTSFGVHTCYVCGAAYLNQLDQRCVFSDDGTKAFFVNNACYQKVRALRRARSTTFYQGLVALCQQLEQSLLGTDTNDFERS